MCKFGGLIQNGYIPCYDWNGNLVIKSTVANEKVVFRKNFSVISTPVPAWQQDLGS
jgi:hypothetical protein